ncbi:MAG: Rha family transcriptional regulator [Campylobacteraceae bacterium]
MQLVTFHNNMPVVSHKVIAGNTGNKEKSILDYLTRFKGDFEDFGQVRFEIATVKNSVGAINQTKTYLLNEQQATLLLTYLQNTPIVRKFKIALVKEFYSLKEQNNQPMLLIAKTLETMLSQQNMMIELLKKEDKITYIDKPASRMALRRLSNEEKFIVKVRDALKKREGLNQGEVLRAAGKSFCDKTALRWLYGYDGIYWKASFSSKDNKSYSYSLIEEV